MPNDPRTHVPHAKTRAPRGFSLIELLVVLAIVAFIVAAAMPNYQSQMLRGHRTEARRLLNEGVLLQERHYAANDSYQHEIDALYTEGQANGRRYALSLSFDLPSHCTVAQDSARRHCFVLIATARDAQSADTACAKLFIDSSGSRWSENAQGGRSDELCW